MLNKLHTYMHVVVDQNCKAYIEVTWVEREEMNKGM